MIHNYMGEQDTAMFSEIVNNLSILAVCEDPETVVTFEYAGKVWPLPRTGQMWLEYELLTSPELPGSLCISTSYRNESNSAPGRYRIIFPMFEFELKGYIEAFEGYSHRIGRMGCGTERGKALTFVEK